MTGDDFQAGGGVPADSTASVAYRGNRHGVMMLRPGGMVHACNARALDLLGLSPGLAHVPFDLRRALAETPSLVTTCAAEGREARVTRPDGRAIEIHVEPLTGGGQVLLIIDITAEKHREDSLHLAETEYRSLFENSVCGIYRDTPEGIPVRANQALVAFNGYATEQEYLESVTAGGGNWYVDPDRARHFTQLMARDGRVRDLVSEVYSHRTRQKYWITENAWYVRDAAGKPVFIEGTIQDATERVQGLTAIERQANTDALTGAASRFHFMNTLDALTRNPGSVFVMMSIDLDKFKEVNDQLGHAAGDAVLKTVVSRLRAVVGPTATIARLGGDEFAVLIPGTVASIKADFTAAEIVRVLRLPFEFSGHHTVIGGSVGVALYPAHAADAKELLNHADLALYQVKGTGRNGSRIFDYEMKASQQRQQAIVSELREAVPGNQLELYYQPIIATGTAATVGYEALMRWNHPRRGLLAPGQFMQVAEEAGLMTELGNWAIRCACQQAVTLPGGVGVAVNVSPSQFRSLGIVETVKQALAATGLEPSRLTIEVTESVILSSEGIAAQLIDDLLDIGIQLALDDFGTGYSSLSYLQRFAFSKVKVDRSFVAGMEKKPANLAIIRAIVRLAQDLGMAVVAEGIETETQAATLRAEGCGFLQGYLFGRPRPFREVAADLAVRNLRNVLPETMATQTPLSAGKRIVHNTL